MGAWGPGLHSSDAAADLRSALSAVCRLPLAGKDIVDLLVGLEPAASDPTDEDHTTFWLVLADGLQRRGIASPAQERALAIIADGSDLRMHEELGMEPADLRARTRVLADVERRLRAPLPDKARKTLSKPQPLLLAPGEVHVFPVDSRGNCPNPYYARPDEAGFEQAGWGSCLVLAADHALGYLAWYQIAPCLEPSGRRPTLAEALDSIDPTVNGTATMSRSHKARMGLEVVGTIAPPAVAAPEQSRIVQTVAADISASNLLSRWFTRGTVQPIVDLREAGDG